MERLAEGIRRADAAGDAAAVRLLGERYRELQGDRPIGALTIPEINALDPSRHGGVSNVAFGPGEALALGAPAVPAIGRAALAGTKALGKYLAMGAGAGGGIETIRRFMDE